MSRQPFRVLFVSTGNSCRSQIAEGWMRRLAPPHVVVRSAGVAPRHLHPLAVRAMQEAGVDIAGQRGKSVEPMARERFDLVVTLCESAASACPPLPLAAARMHRPFDDPSYLCGPDDEDLDDFRSLRDALRTFVAELLETTRCGGAAS